ncbi:hypothetical protein, partial [Escherichia sp. 20412-1]|uniref:hypothetical protein n=1 Tax=Escherichia sp. 20412-1 TaxID=2137853 RepID=UPI001C635EC2
QAFVTIAGCCVNALSGLQMAQESVGLIRRASVASGICHHCRMLRERLIRPTNGARISRPDKTRERRIRHLSPLPDAARTPYPACEWCKNQ